MASNVDTTTPADGQKADKAKIRQNWQIIKEEIEDLQDNITYARQIAFGIVRSL